jgi:hypothetical protein
VLDRIEYALILCLFNVHSYLPTHYDTKHRHGNSLFLPKLSQKLKILILHHCEYGLHIIYGSLSASVDVSVHYARHYPRDTAIIYKTHLSSLTLNQIFLSNLKLGMTYFAFYLTTFFVFHLPLHPASYIFDDMSYQ